MSAVAHARTHPTLVNNELKQNNNNNNKSEQENNKQKQQIAHRGKMIRAAGTSRKTFE